MCDQKLQRGRDRNERCERRGRYWASVATVPQALGPNGEYGMETVPAARSRIVCGTHLATAVLGLYALDFKMPGATVEVRLIRTDSEMLAYNKRTGA